MGAMQTVGDVSRQLAAAAGAGSFVSLGATGEYKEEGPLRSPVVPTPGAFSIWGPIYATNLALVADQLWPSRRRDPLLRQIGWPLALAQGGAGLWSRTFERKRLPETIGIIGTTTGAAALAYARLPAHRPTTTREQWLVRVPVGLLFGWLTVASAAGLTEELLDPAVSDLDPDAERLAVGTIAAVTAVAGAVTVGMDRTLAYPAAVAWGLGGIVVARAGERPAVAAAAAAGLAALGVATGIALWRRQRARSARNRRISGDVRTRSASSAPAVTTRA